MQSYLQMFLLGYITLKNIIIDNYMTKCYLYIENSLYNFILFQWQKFSLIKIQ